MKKFFSMLIVSACTLGFNSCSLGDYGSVDLFPRGVGNITYFNYKINLHRINVYPSGCKIIVDEYSSVDSVSFLKSGSTFNITMPASDTTYSAGAFSSNFYYLKWKVTGPNNDSIAGGRTPGLKMKALAIFEINY